MDVGLDRPHRPAEGLGHLGIGQALDVAQDHRLPPAPRQGGQELGQLLPFLANRVVLEALSGIARRRATQTQG